MARPQSAMSVGYQLTNAAMDDLRILQSRNTSNRTGGGLGPGGSLAPGRSMFLPAIPALDSGSKAIYRVPSSQTHGNSMASEAAAEDFRKEAAGYLNDDRRSDFIVVCDGKEFKVHRCFIYAHSKWFARCCAGEFLVSRASRLVRPTRTDTVSQEAGARKVELKEDLLMAVEQMITFFYTCDYDDSVAARDPSPSSGDPTSDCSLQMNAWVYATAEK